MAETHYISSIKTSDGKRYYIKDKRIDVRDKMNFYSTNDGDEEDIYPGTFALIKVDDDSSVNPYLYEDHSYNSYVPFRFAIINTKRETKNIIWNLDNINYDKTDNHLLCNSGQYRFPETIGGNTLKYFTVQRLNGGLFFVEEIETQFDDGDV